MKKNYIGCPYHGTKFIVNGICMAKTLKDRYGLTNCYYQVEAQKPGRKKTKICSECKKNPAYKIGSLCSDCRNKKKREQYKNKTEGSNGIRKRN